MENNYLDKCSALTLLVPRAPIGRVGRPVSPSFSLQPSLQ